MGIRQTILEKLIHVYGPFLGAGIRVTKKSRDFRHMRVEMPLTFYNRNYVGTQFGGSLYSMVDPFYMLMLIKNLGPDYIVWDKAATINFRKPGRGRVHAEFNLTEEKIEEIKAIVKEKNKMDAKFRVEIKDEAGILVADVEKTIYIRRKI